MNQAERIRHTCAGGVREAGVQIVPECIEEPQNCTMIKSLEVTLGHKDNDQCYASCLDGFRGSKTFYYCPRLNPQNFDPDQQNYKIVPHPIVSLTFETNCGNNGNGLTNEG